MCVYVQVNCVHNNYYVVTVFMYCCNVCVCSCDLNSVCDGEEGRKERGREKRRKGREKRSKEGREEGGEGRSWGGERKGRS